jgi:hypothetical protein
MSEMGLVSRVTPVQTALRNCTRDEGRSFEVGNQVLISSHRKLLSSKAIWLSLQPQSEVLRTYPVRSLTTRLTSVPEPSEHAGHAVPTELDLRSAPDKTSAECPMSGPDKLFTDGKVYERLMGRWSRLVAEAFLDWLNAPKNLRWLDVGCGNGAFTEELITRCAPQP